MANNININSAEVKDRIILSLLKLVRGMHFKGYKLSETNFNDEQDFILWIEDLEPHKDLRLEVRADSTRFTLKVEDD
jgi:hypothetical protein